MAKIFSANTIDNNGGSFTPDKNGDAARNVVDVEGNEILTSINAAVGGSINTTPTIFNIVQGPVNTEQSQALPANTKKFVIKTRGNSELKLSFVATESGTNYIDIKKNAVYTDINLYTSQTIYFQSPNTGDVVEIIAFV